ncbi:MAG: SIMPL domain-containing protein [Candidatus Latescibacterota bacterium]|nr:MAG: SIMPL domain-containing protein [Candidatus Latescibacterota bacterium]
MARVFCISLCFVLMVFSTASGEEPGLVRTISVSGTVEWKIAPDHIVWKISLTDYDKNLSAAKAKSDEKIKSVVALQKDLSINEGDIETGVVNVRREYEVDKHGRKGEFKYFVVSRSVTLRQRDLKRFDEFFDTLVSSANMEVSFSFESSQTHEVRADMRLKALQVAKEKAAAMADVVGAKLGQVLTINEYRPSSRAPSPFNVSVVYTDPSTDLATETFVPGAINQKVTVYVTFELESL